MADDTIDGELASLAKAVRAGERRALARAITLIESTRPDHREQAEVLLERLLPETGGSIRIGISGTPGVGKSSFIEAFGLYAIDQGHKVAVLAVDPTSERSGGSLLGDKTRMEKLSVHANAFIRPSPTSGTLGGVARRTREAILATEAAGFDVVLIETVGVGQSETAVSHMADLFLLLIQPAGGDELQGLKRGIMELADLVVVNKADGELIPAATRAVSDYRAALQLLRPPEEGWAPQVLRCSALTGDGIAEVWETVLRFRDEARASGRLEARRRRQAVRWMWDEVTETLKSLLRADPEIRPLLGDLEARVLAGEITAPRAAAALLAAFMGGHEENPD